MLPEILTEEKNFQSPNEDSLQRKLLSSKLKSLNQQIQNLLQKRIRLDLEIKRTKQKISKLKTQSETLVKAKIELEGFSEETFSPEDKVLLEEAMGSEEFLELLEFCSQINLSEENLKEAEEFPLIDL